MIVPMKKISLIVMGDKKKETLRILRKLGILHIEISEGHGEELQRLKEKRDLLEGALFILSEKKIKNAKKISVDYTEALNTAREIISLEEEKKQCLSQKLTLISELERLKDWGDIEPLKISELKEKGIELHLFDSPVSEYEALGEDVKTLCLEKTKHSVKFALIKEEDTPVPDSIKAFCLTLPEMSTAEIKEKIRHLEEISENADKKICSMAGTADSIKTAVNKLLQETQFEIFNTGMETEYLSPDEKNGISVAYFTGFVEEENLPKLQDAARENKWGLVVSTPTEEDDAPTKLKNNKFVSLIYPLTDFLGTVPGYFEYDISGWFLSFILIFFGIIFGDGGYGLLICSVTGALIIKSVVSKKSISPAFLLVGLLGLSTILWGTLTCTWFGLSPEQIPLWLQKLSIPVISNVYADKIWYPFWTGGEYGLTTAQNLQIFCFTLALIQLSVAHIKVAVRNRKSLKILGDIGSVMQLLGIYYVVLSFVVNAQVFSFSLVIGGIPVGTAALILVGTGFVLSFVFSNFEGSIIKSVLASLKNIVSVLLGVVNVFSDIVSYIRLWAVGLAGAAISQTVNELASPMLGKLMFMIFAIILLVFGHGLNMILNVLSVIVHGIRLNTLEFSSHLDMSWSGHKFTPFKEQTDK